MTPLSKMSTRQRARRAGSARMAAHRQRGTAVYNPLGFGDCGYACVLRAAKRKVSASNIAKFRKQTAAMMHEMYLKDEHFMGDNIRDMVSST